MILTVSLATRMPKTPHLTDCDNIFINKVVVEEIKSLCHVQLESFKKSFHVNLETFEKYGTSQINDLYNMWKEYPEVFGQWVTVTTTASCLRGFLKS